MKRKASASDKRYLAAVAEMGCIVCESLGFYGTPAQVHHVKVETGWGRDGHRATIPLCWEHHQGATGIHMLGRRHFANLYGKSELEFMEIVQKRLEGVE